MGSSPFWVLCRDRVSTVLRRNRVFLCRDRGPRLRTGHGLGSHSRRVRGDASRVRQQSSASDIASCCSMSRHGFPVSRQDSQACWVTWVSTKAFWVLCRDRGLCHDRAWSRPRGLVSRHSKCVATGWLDGGVLSRQGILYCN